MATNDRERSGGLAVAVDHIEELEDGFCTVEGKILDRDGEPIIPPPVIWLGRVVNSLITEMIIYDDLDEARMAARLRTTEPAANRGRVSGRGGRAATAPPATGSARPARFAAGR